MSSVLYCSGVEVHEGAEVRLEVAGLDSAISAAFRLTRALEQAIADASPGRWGTNRYVAVSFIAQEKEDLLRIRGQLEQLEGALRDLRDDYDRGVKSGVDRLEQMDSSRSMLAATCDAVFHTLHGSSVSHNIVSAIRDFARGRQADPEAAQQLKSTGEDEGDDLWASVRLSRGWFSVESEVEDLEVDVDFDSGAEPLSPHVLQMPSALDEYFIDVIHEERTQYGSSGTCSPCPSKAASPTESSPPTSSRGRGGSDSTDRSAAAPLPCCKDESWSQVRPRMAKRLLKVAAGGAAAALAVLFGVGNGWAQRHVQRLRGSRRTGIEFSTQTLKVPNGLETVEGRSIAVWPPDR